MTTSAIRERLHTCLDVATDKKLRAIYTLIEDDMPEKGVALSHWDDPEFVAEMNRRVAEMESGADKGKSWEEVKTSIRNRAKMK